MSAPLDLEGGSEVSDKYKVVKPNELVDKRRLFVVLENASLETVKTKEGKYELLNCDDHIKILKKMKRDWTEVRPDITHQCLLTLLDSPLNKSGHLQVYVHTKKNVLIENSVQLLHENRIKATNTDGGVVLLKLIKNPITLHLPLGIKKIVCTSSGPACNLSSFLKKTLSPLESVVFVIGAISKGSDRVDYADQYVSFSNYPLSASVTCGRLCCAMEDHWDIL